MISLANVTLYRGGRRLFANVTLRVHAKQKVGVIGANGSGKSSLFALLRGQLQADAGEVRVPANWNVAAVAQQTPRGARPAIDFIMDGDAELRRVQADLKAARGGDDGTALARLHERYDAIDGYTAQSRAARLLRGLGFAGEDAQRAVDAFSGGWRRRLALAQTLMARCDLLLLDEPTNHLDLDAILWLEQWLRGFPGTVLLISHDREFLDNCVTGIAAIDEGTIRLYEGNYTRYEQQYVERLARQAAAAEKQRCEVARVKAFVARFRAKASKARQVQSRIKALARLQVVAAARADSPYHFSFPEPGRCANPLVRMEGARLGYGSQVVLEQINLDLAPGDRVGLLGRNGAGKSTLMKGLAGTLAPCAGSYQVGQEVRLGYFAQHQLDQLDLTDHALGHLRRLPAATTEQYLRDFLGGFGFQGEDATRPVATFSGGERSRLALALLVFSSPQLLLLDEPTNHLDLRMRDALTLALQGFSGAVVLVSHDRHLLRATVDRLLLVHRGTVESFDGDLEQYRRWLLQTAPDKPTEPTAPTQTVRSARGRRHRRRQEAETRSRTRPLRQRLERLEAELERLQAERRTLEQTLARPELYATDRRDELHALLVQQAALERDRKQIERQWLETSEELEAFEGTASW